MSLSRFDTFARSVVGPSAAGAQVFLCLQPVVTTSLPPSPLAQLYSDPLGANPISQPLICDGFGHASCYVASGTFTEVVVYGGMLVQVYPDQFIASTIAVQVNGLEVNGNPVTGPNFNSSVPAIPIGSSAVNWQFDGLGNVSGSVLTSTFAPLASPAFTGTPTAPTAASSDDSTTIATTAYVQSVIASSGLVVSVFGRTGAVVATPGDYTVAQVTGAAPLVSPAFSGIPTAPTPASVDNSTTLATTAYVQAQGYSSGTVTAFSSGNIGTIATTTVATATTTPALTFSLATQAANTVWAGPTSGSAATPTFRVLVPSDIPSEILSWNLISNATGALTLANGNNATTFNQTSAVTWGWANTTAATIGTGQDSPILTLSGTYYGSAAGTLASSSADSWIIQDVLATPAQLLGTTAITTIAESSGSVVTLTLVGSVFYAGELVVLSGFPSGAGSWLNGYTVQLTTAGATTATFTDPTSHGTLVSTPLTGTPVITQVSGLSTLTISNTGSGNGVLIPISPNAVNNSPAALAIGTPLANPLSPGLMLTGTQVGIGTNQYAAAIEIHNSYAVGMNIFVHSNTGFRAPITTYYRSRGTQLSPAAVTNADILAYPNQIYGHDGTGYFASPTLEFRATENWNSTSHGAATDFFSVVNGTTNQFMSMTIDNTGFVGINAGITPGARLSVGTDNGSYPNGAFQVNDLGQATLLTIQYLAAASAPTSAGTAGTAGQIIYYSGLLYFCSVTGGVGSATWNKLSMTAV